MSHEGNQFGIKIKDPELRQLAYKSFCEHIAKGRAIDSWYFEHPEATLSYKTMLKYIKDEEEFPPEQREIAKAKGYAHWEKVVEDSAIGINKDANTASLQMLMRNKFGWDKNTHKPTEDTGELAVGYEKMIMRITSAQKELQVDASNE
jgi:hypothetical protein